MFTPGHTEACSSFLITEVSENSTKTPFLFCGDALFIGGCGRVFSGDFKAMYESLMLLKSLPNETLVFCGHEYTKNNLMFALGVDPSNPILKAKYDWAI